MPESADHDPAAVSGRPRLNEHLVTGVVRLHPEIEFVRVRDVGQTVPATKSGQPGRFLPRRLPGFGGWHLFYLFYAP